MSDARADRLEAAIENAAAAKMARRIESTLARWANGSRVVGWLLADPDPEVVVIDLRETYTVGPLLGLAERVFKSESRAVEATGLSDVARRLSARVEAEPLRVVGTALAALALLGLASTWVHNGRGAIGGWLVLVGVSLLASRERRSAAELEATRVGAALRAAFDPPEPPEND